eukprot:GHVT01082417.1.p1 GENE.GHVT01082417.1~~GHVT01082417.1.p1  ORF type:complete len:989 (-),score=195.53 GHVT01082417.1:661-3627(-)
MTQKRFCFKVPKTVEKKCARRVRKQIETQCPSFRKRLECTIEKGTRTVPCKKAVSKRAVHPCKQLITKRLCADITAPEPEEAILLRNATILEGHSRVNEPEPQQTLDQTSLDRRTNQPDNRSSPTERHPGTTGSPAEQAATPSPTDWVDRVARDGVDALPDPRSASNVLDEVAADDDYPVMVSVAQLLTTPLVLLVPPELRVSVDGAGGAHGKTGLSNSPRASGVTSRESWIPDPRHTLDVGRIPLASETEAAQTPAASEPLGITTSGQAHAKSPAKPQMFAPGKDLSREVGKLEPRAKQRQIYTQTTSEDPEPHTAPHDASDVEGTTSTAASAAGRLSEPAQLNRTVVPVSGSGVGDDLSKPSIILESAAPAPEFVSVEGAEGAINMSVDQPSGFQQKVNTVAEAVSRSSASTNISGAPNVAADSAINQPAVSLLAVAVGAASSLEAAGDASTVTSVAVDVVPELPVDPGDDSQGASGSSRLSVVEPPAQTPEALGPDEPTAPNGDGDDGDAPGATVAPEFRARMLQPVLVEGEVACVRELQVPVVEAFEDVTFTEECFDVEEAIESECRLPVVKLEDYPCEAVTYQRECNSVSRRVSSLCTEVVKEERIVDCAAFELRQVETEDCPDGARRRLANPFRRLRRISDVRTVPSGPTGSPAPPALRSPGRQGAADTPVDSPSAAGASGPRRGRCVREIPVAVPKKCTQQVEVEKEVPCEEKQPAEECRLVAVRIPKTCTRPKETFKVQKCHRTETRRKCSQVPKTGEAHRLVMRSSLQVYPCPRVGGRMLCRDTQQLVEANCTATVMSTQDSDCQQEHLEQTCKIVEEEIQNTCFKYEDVEQLVDCPEQGWDTKCSTVPQYEMGPCEDTVTVSEEVDCEQTERFVECVPSLVPVDKLCLRELHEEQLAECYEETRGHKCVHLFVQRNPTITRINIQAERLVVSQAQLGDDPQLSDPAQSLISDSRVAEPLDDAAEVFQKAVHSSMELTT